MGDVKHNDSLSHCLDRLKELSTENKILDGSKEVGPFNSGCLIMFIYDSVI